MPEAPAPRPNVLLILNDDMGFSDLGCYGGEVDTPALNRLAEGGLRFTQFYNTARCCPSRASLLTGLHPHQAGVGLMAGTHGPDGYEGTLNDRCVTIAEVLREAGYATAMSGKWHVSGEEFTPNPAWPTGRGFDRYYGIVSGAADYFAPGTLARNMEVIAEEARNDPDYYLTDAISDNAVEQIREHFAAAPDRPLFQYVAYTAPHWPLHAREEDAAKYKGRFDAGWDRLREERLERMVAMGIIHPDWALSPRDPGELAWEDAPDKSWQARRMEVYAAQIEVMDRGIGRIVQALEEAGQLENTLILFLADNGGCAEEIPPEWERWLTAARIANTETRDGRPVRFGNRPDIRPGSEETYASCGVPWANLSNTPFRFYKHWIHEGGVATPLIVHWPKGLKQSGALHHNPWHLPDVMATVVEAAGAPYPDVFKGVPIQPLEGRSFARVFEDLDAHRDAMLFWEHEGNAAARDGRWKLVRNFSGTPSATPNHGIPHEKGGWELYDMVTDRTEMHDLAAEMPERVCAMRTEYERWATRCGVLDYDELRAWLKNRHA